MHIFAQYKNTHIHVSTATPAHPPKYGEKIRLSIGPRFLFCGSTGVGKTALCKTLATTFFGTEDGLKEQTQL